MGDPNAEDRAVHGFGATPTTGAQPARLAEPPTYAIDLLGFGRGDQPQARLKDEAAQRMPFIGFDLWGQQVADSAMRWCNDRYDWWATPSAGSSPCSRTTAGRSLSGRGADRRPARWTTSNWPPTSLDDLDQAAENDGAAAAQPALPDTDTASVIRNVLKQAYPSGANIDDDLVDLLFQPTQRQCGYSRHNRSTITGTTTDGRAEASRGSDLG